jgi:hypothetical protein
MKKLTTLILSIVAILPAKPAFAQTSENRLSLHISENFQDFNISILNKKFTSFDSTLSNTLRTGIQYYIDRHWTLVAGISNGFYLNQIQEGILVKKSFVTGIDADILYKFNNNRRFSEKALIGPFFSFGYEVSYLAANKKAGLNSFRVSNGYGAGVNLRLSPSTSLVIHSSVYQQLGGDFDTRFSHRIGYIYTFGVNKKERRTEPELKKPQPPDRDNDGVSDDDDVCPDMPGHPEYGGCNYQILTKGGWQAAMDSLIKKVATIKGTLDSIKEEKEMIKTDLNKEKEEIATEEKPTETLPEVLEKKPVQPEIIEKEEVVMMEKKPIHPKVSDPVDENKMAPSYYVITISTKQFYLAKQTADGLKKDYPKVEILPQPNGYFRVGIYATSSRSEALKILDYAKTHGITSAWLSFE